MKVKNLINQFKAFNTPFDYVKTDKAINMMEEYSENFELLKAIVDSCDFSIKLCGVDKAERFKYEITIDRDNKIEFFEFTVSSNDSFFIDTVQPMYTEGNYRYKISQCNKYFKSHYKQYLNTKGFFIKNNQAKFIEQFLYSFLCCLGSDYSCDYDNIDDFHNELCSGMNISDTMKSYNGLKEQNQKTRHLFTEDELSSFPS